MGIGGPVRSATFSSWVSCFKIVSMSASAIRENDSSTFVGDVSIVDIVLIPLATNRLAGEERRNKLLHRARDPVSVGCLSTPGKPRIGTCTHNNPSTRSNGSRFRVQSSHRAGGPYYAMSLTHRVCVHFVGGSLSPPSMSIRKLIEPQRPRPKLDQLRFVGLFSVSPFLRFSASASAGKLSNTDPGVPSPPHNHPAFTFPTGWSDAIG